MVRPFVINNRCIMDMLCVAVCIRKAIHPGLYDPKDDKATQLRIDPKRCIGCGSCANVCPTSAIVADGDLPVDSYNAQGSSSPRTGASDDTDLWPF